MNLDPRVAIPAALSLVVVLIILSSPLIDIPEIKTEITYEPYSYEQSLIRINQTQKFIFPWFAEVTQAQFLVKNTDSQKGTFQLNFIFDNGTETKTVSKEEEILAGENKAIKVDSPLRGVSTVRLSVIPPNKALVEKRTIMKKVNTWYFFGWSALKLVFGSR